MELSPITANIFNDILQKRTGQVLAPNRLWRVETVLTPLLRERDIASIDALAMHVSSRGDSDLESEIADALLNHETYFYRDPAAFSHLYEAMIERYQICRKANRSMRIWSAGCSTGQEPYSIAMEVMENRELYGISGVEIFGSDVSTHAILKAKSGIYTQFEIQRGLPVRKMLRWFESKDEIWTASRELRNAVHFMVHNLIMIPPSGQFDIVLCRNVMLYFAPDIRNQVFAHMHAAMAPGGVLLLGAGETVIGLTRLFDQDPVIKGLYRRVD